MAAGTVTAGVHLFSTADTRGFKAFVDSLRDLRINLLGFDAAGQALERLGANLRDVGSIGVRGFENLITSAASLDDIMTKVSVAAGPDLKVSTDELTRSFLRMSTTLPLTATELGDTALNAARAGVTSKKALEQIALVSGQLATISDDLTSDKASEALLTFSNNFGRGVNDIEKDAVRLGDAIALLADKSIGTAGQITEIGLRASASAHLLGMTEEQTLALATAARNTGASAEVAGTALSGFLSAATRKTAGFAEVAGISAQRFEEMVNSGQGLEAVKLAIQGVTKNMDGSTRSTTEMSAAIKKLGVEGQRQHRVIMTLAAGYDNESGLAAMLDLTTKAQGQLAAKFSRASQSLAKVIQTLKGAVTNLAISFGLLLAPVVIPLLQLFTAMIEVLIALPAPIKIAMLVVAGLATAFALVTAAALLTLSTLILAGTSLAFLVMGVASAVKQYYAFQRQIDHTTKALKRQARAQAALAAYFPSPYRTSMAGPHAEVKRAARGVKRSRNDGFMGLAADMAEARMGGKALHAVLFARLVPGINKLPGPIRTAAQGLVGFTARVLGAGSVSGGLSMVLKIIGPMLVGIGTTMAWVVGIIAVCVIVFMALKDSIVEVFDAFTSLADPFIFFFSELNAMFAGVGGAVGVFMFAVKVGLGPIILMIESAALSFRMISAFGKGIAEVVIMAIKPLSATIGRFVDGLRHMWAVLGEVANRLGLVWGEGTILEKVLSAVGFIAKVAFAPFAMILRSIVFSFEMLLAVVGGVLEGIMRLLTPIFEQFIAIKTEISLLFGELAAIFRPLTDAFSELWVALGLGSEGFDFFGVVVQGVAMSVRLFLWPFQLLIRGAVWLAQAAVAVGAAFARVIAPAIMLSARPLQFMLWLFTKMFKFFTGGRSLSTAFKAMFEGVGDFADSVSNVLMFIPNLILRAIRLIGQGISAIFDSIFSLSLDPLKWFLNVFVDSMNEIIGGLNLLPGINLGFIQPIPMAIGGITTKDTLAQLHQGEAVLPLERLPEIFSRIAPRQPITQAPMHAATGAPASASGGGPVSLSLSIPVTLMLDGLELGRTLVNVSEEQVRKNFGARGIRLAGVG